MSWWTQAKEIEDFEDKNLVNNSIRQLTSIADNLDYASILVYQTARGARNIVAQLKDRKALSTYKEVRDMLLKADRYALDSPKKFSGVCQKASQKLRDLVAGLEEKREEFGHPSEKVKKGLVE